MKNPVHSRMLTPIALGLSAAFVLAGCGGSDSSPVTTLTGVAAVGAPLAGAALKVSDADPATPDVAGVATGEDGRFSVDVSAMKAPLLLALTGADAAGEQVVLYAVVPAVQKDADNVVNVSPLTHAVAALVAPGQQPSGLADPAVLAAESTQVRVDAAVSALRKTLTADPTIVALLGGQTAAQEFNPMTTPFIANGADVDAVLERIGVRTSAGAVELTNRQSPMGPTAAQATVALTPALLAAPQDAPALPASAAPGDVPSATDLDALVAAPNACFALPAARRITVDSAGQVAAIAAECDYGATGYLHNGRTWAEQQKQDFADVQLDGARFGRPGLIAVFQPTGYTDPKTFKHPICNEATCAIVQFHGRTTKGQPLGTPGLIGKVDGAWKLIGNRRALDLDIQTRLSRYVAVNGAPALPTNYFSLSRYESILRITANPEGADMNDVRALRVTGPGLPAAGVVLSRSNACSIADRMPLAAKDGATMVNNPPVPRYFTSARSIDFKIDAAMLDGSALAFPTTLVGGVPTVTAVDFANAPVADPSATIPAWSVYKWEVFRFGSVNTTPTQPDEVHYVRMQAPALPAAAGRAVVWPELSQASIDAYLKPTGSGAGAISSMSADWTMATGRVDVVYLFAQDVQPVNGTQWLKRTMIVPDIAQIGATSATVTDRVSALTQGTDTSTFTASLSNAVNPRCEDGVASLTPLVPANNAYRELGLFTRDLSSGARRTAIWYHAN